MLGPCQDPRPFSVQLGKVQGSSPAAALDTFGGTELLPQLLRSIELGGSWISN